MTKSKLLQSLLAPIVAFGLAFPIQAQLLVLRSGGSPEIEKKYPRGTKLDKGSTITLPENGWLKILRKSDLETFRGPGTFALSKADPADVRNLSAAEKLERYLIKNRRPRSPHLSREAREKRNSKRAVPDKSPNLWYIDLRYSRARVPAQRKPTLWRLESTDVETIRIREMGEKYLKEVTFRNGNPFAAWPWPDISSPHTESKTYEVFRENADRKSISIIPVKWSNGDGQLQAAEQLIENKCEEQLLVLERALE